MIAQVLSTGDEVLLGDIVDTNAAFLCQRLKELGFTTDRITAVGDDENKIAASLEQISESADLCLVTGGLGPTQDDVTASAAALASGRKLVLDQTALLSMTAYFEKQGFKVNADNRKQAMLPEGADLLPNLHGTAPGFYLQIQNCLFFFMPGVPSEMVRMFENEVKRVLSSRFSLADSVRIERLTIFGMPESRVGALLNEFKLKFPGISLGFRADFPLIEVKLVCSGKTREGKDSLTDLEAAAQWVVQQLGRRVVSNKGCSLAEEIGTLLTQQQKTLAIAESCTGGLISNLVTDVAGSSDYFLFSGVTYSNDAKIKVLGVKEDTLIQHGAVHEQTALEMARGARLKAGSDLAISTTGIAGPGGGTVEKPVGMVCIGLSSASVETSRTYRFTFGDREKNKQMFAAMALELLRRHLTSIP